MMFVQRSQPGFWTNAHGWPADPADHPAGELNPWRPGTLSGGRRAFDQLGDRLDVGPLRRVDETPLKDRYRAPKRETQP